MTVEQNMGFSLKLARASKDDIKSRVGNAARSHATNPRVPSAADYRDILNLALERT